MTPTKRAPFTKRDAIMILIILVVIAAAVWFCIDQVHILEG
jgi:hypothetical protein